MTNQTLTLRRAIYIVLAVSGAFGGGHAIAADTSNAPVLEEIIVTAEKRSQNLQDVPISVVAINAQQVQDAGITNIRNLAILTPGLTVTSEGNEAITTARIRGIGTVGDNPGLESSVGVNIDGVYRPRNGVAFGDLGEIEQIEVLYGPQGTLFGKNNDAGVINVTTKRPSSTFGAMAEVTGGNFNDQEYRASVTGPLAENIAGRLYAGFQQNKGFLDVVNGVGPSTQNNTNDRHAYNVRGQLLFTPIDSVDFLLIADYAKRNESCCSAVVEYPGPFQGLVNVFASTPALGGRTGALGDSPLIGQPGVVRLPSSYVAYDNQIITQHVRDMGVSGELNWNFDFGKLTSITAWRDNTVAGGNDVDYTGIDLLSFPDNGNANSTDFKQFSEELRLAGKVDSLNWLVGGFFSNELLSTRTLGLTGNQFETYISAVASASIGAAFNPLLVSQLTGDAPGATFGGTGYNDGYQQTARSFALFTNETWNITQGLDLTAGLRGTEEKKTATASYNSVGTAPGCGALLNSSLVSPTSPLAGTNAQAFLLGYGCYTGLNPFFGGTGFDQSNTENNLSGTLKLSYRFNEEAMVYVSGANGYKAGGYNLSRVTAAPSATDPIGLTPNYDTHFPRETVDSGEVGIKTTLFDKTLRLNAAAFYQRYTDFQLNTFTGIQFVVTSLDRVVSKGVDVDFAWATPISGLTIAGGVTQDLTNITNFGNALPDFCGGPGNGCTARDNNRLSFAPLWSGALSASYVLPVSATLGIRTSVEEKYNSSYNTGSDLDPRKIQEGFGLLNGRIGFGALDDSWAIEAWGANLADKYYYAVAFDSPFQFNTIASYLGAPRTFGLTARMKFK
ncbi:MAG TPA: TonB-dependent receptor [Steroidobacteraceae bacterium]|jgi:iron complex outermembrane receptor protein|nr:TonB-dependent receptor [Steroidobacteraceae bacterium]